MVAKSGKKTYDLFSKGRFAWVIDNDDENKLITPGSAKTGTKAYEQSRWFSF